MAKLKTVKLKRGYFHGESNNNLNLKTCKDKKIIQLIIQSYVLYCYKNDILCT